MKDKKMRIVSKLIGGLGNQMFRYAAGKALALENGVSLELDISLLIDHAHIHSEYDKRDFELNIFPNITENVIDLKKTNRSFFIRNLLKFVPFGTKPLPVYNERQFTFDPDFLRLHPPVIIHGDWQTELYFKKYESQIRHCFAFSPLENSDSNTIIANAIKNTNAVSVHVRRGDYLNPSILSLNGICSESYYENAIGLILKQVKNPFFYFFSDDTSWVKKNLTKFTANYVIVEGNTGENSWKDMYLMSICKHHIIANSSFSWWGAWLNPAKDKQVVAPLKWFATKDTYYNTKDLIPSGWLRI